MTGSREGFGYDKPLWKQRRVHLLHFPDHKATETRKLKQKPQKNNKKRKGQNSGCHKPYPLKEISSLRFGCSGNKYEDTVLRKPFPTRVSFFLFLFPLNFYLTGPGWVALLYPHSDRSYLACSCLCRLQILFRPADLTDCDGFSRLKYMSVSQIHE